MTPVRRAATVFGLALTCVCGCWRMQEVGGWSPDGGEAGDTGEGGSWVWEAMPSPTEKHLADVWGTAFDNVWAVGEDGTILHFDGQSWSAVQYVPTNFNLHSISGTSSSQIWAAGAERVVLGFDGDAWQSYSTAYGPTEFPGGWRGVCARDAEWAFIAGEGATLGVYDGSDFGGEGLAGVVAGDFHDVWCGGSGLEVFIAGHDHTAFSSSMLLRYNWFSHQWQPMAHEHSDNMYGIAGDGGGNVWAAGFGDGIGSKLYLTTGEAWNVERTSPHELLGLWADVELGLWAVGNTSAEPAVAVVQGWTGGGEPPFELVYDGTTRLRGVWGIDENGDRHVFAVGKNGAILHVYWEPS